MTTLDLTKSLALGLACAVTANASLVIDAFTSPPLGQAASLVSTLDGAVSGPCYATGLSDVLGGSRDILIQLTHTTGTSNITALANQDAGVFKFNNDLLSTSTCSLTWDANGVGLKQDFSAEPGLLLFSASNDHAATYKITIRTFGLGSSSAIINAPEGYGQNLAFPFGDFTADIITGADLTQIDSVSLYISGGNALDVNIDAVTTIPEPSTAGLAMLGIGAFGLARRRRN